jgi:hypothetical protein
LIVAKQCPSRPPFQRRPASLDSARDPFLNFGDAARNRRLDLEPEAKAQKSENLNLDRVAYSL